VNNIQADVNESAERSAPGSRKWASSGDTRRRVIEGAVEVFSERGFAEATVSDVVARSGVSTGSIYHHFGGKGELFLAIWDDLSSSVEDRMRTALETEGLEPAEKFEVAVRAYLWGMWEFRTEAMVLASGDAPKGFESARRKRMLESTGRMVGVLGLGSTPQDRLVARFIIAVLSEGAFSVAGARDREYADLAIEETVRWLGEMGPGRV
jgi:AcrR family transcriptional regulator